MSEFIEQKSLFQWAFYNSNKYPELKLLFCVPNGGLREKSTAIRLKYEGVKSGVFDIFWPVARHGYHGMCIEMKYGKNKLTEQQEWWQEQLTTQGYKTAVCYSWTEAKDEILEYLNA